MKWFSIGGVEWDVHVFDIEESFTILDTQNAGRTSATGAPMELDRLGTFHNYKVTVGKKRGREAEFDALWEYIAVPRNSMMRVVLPKNRISVWRTVDSNGNISDGFDAYVSGGSRKIRRIVEDTDGNLKDVLYDSFVINIVAAKAQVLPSNEQ